MEIPGYIKDFVQMNFYISAEDLNVPFDEMKPFVQYLIKTKCMEVSAEGQMTPKSEEQIAEAANQQMLEDIDSDISDDRQVENFVQHHKVLTGLMKLAEQQTKHPSDFEKAAHLLAAKRLASEEYAHTPKTLSQYMKVQKEIATELEVKYWTTRYFEANPPQPATFGNYQEKVTQDIATISQMVQTNQAHKIAARFSIPDTKESENNAKGATLSFAMTELKVFANKVEKQVKDSPFVKNVNSLTASFQKKYPKTFMATKMVANMGAAMTLGPVFSAYRAVTGINGMRKDYAKHKAEHPNEKGSFWKFLRSKDGRQKLLSVGQNTLRLIPGARAVGVALSAVRNSDGLRNSIRDLKGARKNGGSAKKAWLKVGAATVGLLAISVTAACMNDEIAETVGEFVNNTLDPIKDTIHDSVENVAMLFNHTAEAATFDMSDAADMMQAADMTQAADIADGIQLADTVSVSDHMDAVSFENASVSDHMDTASIDDVPVSDHSGFEMNAQMDMRHPGLISDDPPAEVQHTDLASGGAKADVQHTDLASGGNKLGDQHTDLASGGAKADVQHTDLASGGAKADVQHTDLASGGAKTDVQHTDLASGGNKLGDQHTDLASGGNKLGDQHTDLASGGAKADVQHTDLASGGAKADVQHTDLASGGNKLGDQHTDLASGGNKLGDQHTDLASGGNKLGDQHTDLASGGNKFGDQHTDLASGGNKLGDQHTDLASGGAKTDVQHTDLASGGNKLGDQHTDLASGGAKADVQHTDLASGGNGTRVTNATSDMRAGTSNMSISHEDGSSTYINETRSGVTVQHTDGATHNRVSIGDDGKISATGNINRSIDPTKDGVTVTHVGYDTEHGNYNATVTDNQTGTKYYGGTDDQLGQTVGVETTNGIKVEGSRSTGGDYNLKASADKIDLKNGDTIRNANVNVGAGTGSGTVYHEDGSDTYLNRTRSGTTIQHTDGATHNRVSVGDDGKISATGNINRSVDPTKDGVTVTHVGYDTDHDSANVTLTDNQTGTKYYGGTDDQLGQTVGVETTNGIKVEGSRSTGGDYNVTASADKIDLKNGDTIRNANVNVGAGTGSGSVYHEDGSDTYLNRTRSGTTVQHTDGATHNRVSIGDDGKISATGNINRSIDPTKSGATVTHVGYDTEHGSYNTTVTDNQTGTKYYGGTDDQLGQTAGIETRDGIKVEGSRSTGGDYNVKARADKIDLENGDTIRNANANTAGRNGSGTIYHEDGSDTYINRTRSGTTVQHSDGATHNRVSLGDDGKLGATGNINRSVDPTKDGATVTHVGYDTEHGSYNTTVTDNQSGTKYYGATDGRDGQTVGMETRGGVKVEADRSGSGSLNAKLRADKVKLGEDTTMNNTNVNVSAGTASTSINHGDGSDTYVNRTRSGTTVQHTNGASHNSVSVGDDGSVEVKGNINRDADPTKDGVTVTHVGYNTGKGEAEATITNNRTGRKVYVEKEKDGFTIGTEKGPDSRTSVSVDKSGDINIKGKGGRSVNVTKAIKFIRGLTR